MLRLIFTVRSSMLRSSSKPFYNNCFRIAARCLSAMLLASLLPVCALADGGEYILKTDLALRMYAISVNVTATGLNGLVAAPLQTPVQDGNLVAIGFRVFNQSTRAAIPAEIVVGLPTTMTFDPGLNPGWERDGARLFYNPTDIIYPATASQTPNDTSKVVATLHLTVAGNPPGGLFEVYGEISKLRNADGDVLADIDSTPDRDLTNDFCKDDVIDEDGRKSGEDEDDHDVVALVYTAGTSAPAEHDGDGEARPVIGKDMMFLELLLVLMRDFIRNTIL